VDARINRFSTQSQRRSDGVVLWPRYVTPYELYFAYMLRRDGRVAITKKCPGRLPGGNYYNLGTYFNLSPEYHRGRLQLDRWYRIASSVQTQPNGSVTIRLFRDGRLVAQATDRGVGCAPLVDPAHLGIRADYVNANLAHYRVYALSPVVPVSCADALVGQRRATEKAKLTLRDSSVTAACPALLRSSP
jgi:hypothetical protein